jgi:purine nucleosidase
MAHALWIDCDTGLDDALALLYACRAQGTELVGVSTVAGNCPLAQATANTLAVLGLAGRTPPVVPGAARPLLAEPSYAREVHGADGLGGLAAELPAPTAAPAADPGHAAAALSQAAQARPGVLTVVATGPLTNLALAGLLDPELPRRVRALVAMGGAVAVPGNVGPVTEFNFGFDPEAAALVLRQGWPLTVVPLDVTLQCLAGPREADRLEGAADPVAAFVARALRRYQEAYEARLGRRAAPLHDPLAVAVALDPTLVDAVEVPVAVETRGEVTRGMLVADRRPGRAPGGPTARVALRVDADRALGRLLAHWAQAPGS